MGYNGEVTATGPLSFGRVSLRGGANEIVAEIVGKDARSTGYLVGLDGWTLRP